MRGLRVNVNQGEIQHGRDHGYQFHPVQNQITKQALLDEESEDELRDCTHKIHFNLNLDNLYNILCFSQICCYTNQIISEISHFLIKTTKQLNDIVGSQKRKLNNIV